MENQFKQIGDMIKEGRPRPLGEDEKSRLWLNITQKLGARSSFSPFTLVPNFTTRRLALALLIAAIIITGTGITVAAANSSNPGDTLFGVKIASEKVQLAFSFGNKKNELKLKFASERLAEAQETVNAFFNAAAVINGSSATSTSQTEDNTATTTATTTDNGALATSTQDVNEKVLGKAEAALDFALNRLERTRNEFEKAGNEAAVQKINGIISELSTLAENHISKLEKLELSIKTTDKKLNIKIKASGDKLKKVFKTNQTLNQDEDDDEDEDEDDDENRDRKITICHIPPGNPGAKHTITIGAPALQAHLKHGDTEGPCKEDTIELVITGISSEAATSTAIIKWDTNEPSTSKVTYGTSTPLGDSANTVESTTLVEHHSLLLENLSASTTYSFIVTSTDASGNSASSSEHSFTTLALPDTEAPLLSNILAGNIASTTATVSWTTNEPANGTVWYGTEAPLIISSSTPFATNLGLTLSHSFMIDGLTASTTYSYIVASTDEVNNTATSTEQSFATLPE